MPATVYCGIDIAALFATLDALGRVAAVADVAGEGRVVVWDAFDALNASKTAEG